MAKKPTISDEFREEAYRQLRIIALNTASTLVNINACSSAKQVVKDAETYFQFLTK